jgi:hypothetical protein
VAVPHRCLGGVEAALCDSRISVAGSHRCLGGAETAVCDS